MKKTLLTLSIILISLTSNANERLVKFDRGKKVVIKTICIDGYKYVIASTTIYGGVSVTQMFEKNSFDGKSMPIRCEK